MCHICVLCECQMRVVYEWQMISVGLPFCCCFKWVFFRAVKWTKSVEAVAVAVISLFCCVVGMYISYKRERGVCRCTLHSTNVSIPANRRTTRHYEWVVYCWRSGDEVANAMHAAADVETADADKIPIRCCCCRCRCCCRCGCCSVAVSLLQLARPFCDNRRHVCQWNLNAPDSFQSV